MKLLSFALLGFVAANVSNDTTTIAPVSDPSTVAPVSDPSTVAPKSDPSTVAPKSDPSTVAPKSDPKETKGTTTKGPLTNGTTTASAMIVKEIQTVKVEMTTSLDMGSLLGIGGGNDTTAVTEVINKCVANPNADGCGNMKKFLDGTADAFKESLKAQAGGDDIEDVRVSAMTPKSRRGRALAAVEYDIEFEIIMKETATTTATAFTKTINDNTAAIGTAFAAKAEEKIKATDLPGAATFVKPTVTVKQAKVETKTVTVLPTITTAAPAASGAPAALAFSTTIVAVLLAKLV